VVAGALRDILRFFCHESFGELEPLCGLVGPRPHPTGTHLSTAPGFSTFYPPLTEGLRAFISFVISGYGKVQAHFGLGPNWLAVALFAAGLVTVFRLGRPATAVALAALWPEMLALSVARKYPFLDLRTSTFLFAITVVVAAIGLVRVGSLLRSWLKGAVAAGLVVIALAVFAWQVHPYVRGRVLPIEDVRDQARYVAAHAALTDVVVVNLDSNWGFAYYWPIGHPARRPDGAVAQDYEAYFPGQPRIIVARNRDTAGVDAAVSQALARVRPPVHAPGSGWSVRTRCLPKMQRTARRWLAAGCR
jgi:hypothetical protein